MLYANHTNNKVIEAYNQFCRFRSSSTSQTIMPCLWMLEVKIWKHLKTVKNLRVHILSSRFFLTIPLPLARLEYLRILDGKVTWKINNYEKLSWSPRLLNGEQTDRQTWRHTGVVIESGPILKLTWKMNSY